MEDEIVYTIEDLVAAADTLSLANCSYESGYEVRGVLQDISDNTLDIDLLHEIAKAIATARVPA